MAAPRINSIHMTLCDGAASVMKLIDSDFMGYSMHLKVHVDEAPRSVWFSKNLEIYVVDKMWVIIRDFKPIKVLEVSPDHAYNVVIIEKAIQSILNVNLPLEGVGKVVEYLKVKQ